jgi:outer membrane protein assembly factor BamB
MKKILLLVVLLAFSTPIQAAETANEFVAVRATDIESGLVVVVGASDTNLAESLTADGRMAVDLLTTIDEAQANAWRERLAKKGRSGFVSVVALKTFTQLPYPSRFVNVLIADLDSLGDAAPTDTELHRVVASYGALCLRSGGKWKVEKIGLAPELDEWTHFEHGPDGNPVSKDEVVNHVRGLQWASYDIQYNPGSTPRIGSGAHVRAVADRDRNQNQTTLIAREAANGLLRWRVEESEGHRWRRSEVFEKSWCIADGRVHGLVGDNDKWAQSIDLATGKTLLVYDQGIPAPVLPDSELRKRLTDEEFRWKSDVTVGGQTNTRGPYSLGMPHIALGGMILQGGNIQSDGKPMTITLGPTRLEERRRRRGEPQGPQSVTQSVPLKGLVVALDPADGSGIWTWEAPQGLQVAHLVGDKGSVVVGLTQTTIGLGVHYRNRFTRLAEVVVLEAKTGKQRWRSDKVQDFLLHHLAIAEGGLYVGDHHIYSHEGDLKRMIRFNLATGRIDFDVTPDIDNKADNWKNRFAILEGRIRLGGYRNLVDLDASTGEDVKITRTTLPGYDAKVPGLSLGHCSTWRATPNGWLSGRFARFIPFDGAMENRAAVARNWCDEGHYPAYGLMYSGYHPGCFCSTYLVGHVALHSQPSVKPIPDEQRLTRGPAWGTALTNAEAKDQWPTFRANANRSNYVEANLGSTLKPLGSDQLVAARREPSGDGLPSPQEPGGLRRSATSINSPLAEDWRNSIVPPMSAPVVVDGTVLVSLVHERRLVALDLVTGDERWSRPLAARSVYPPTVHRGLVFVGGNDGTVSCLRLADGELVWKFLAAPSQRRAIVASQVESAWPVPGVVVYDRRLYAVAGSHNQLDGGLYVWALDPADGSIWGRTVVTSGFSNQPPLNKAPALDFEGRTNDIPSIDRQGRALHVRDIAIDTKTWNWLNICAFLDRKVEKAAGFTRKDLPALFTRPLENHNAFYRPIRLRYAGGGLGIKFNMTHLAWHGNSHDVEGDCMAIGPERLVVIQRGKLQSYALDKRGLPRTREKSPGDFARILDSGNALSKDYRPRTAVAMTSDHIVMTQPATQNKPGSLVLMTADGTELATAELPADPQPASLAIAGKFLVVGTMDGTMHRFTTSD